MWKNITLDSESEIAIQKAFFIEIYNLFQI